MASANGAACLTAAAFGAAEIGGRILYVYCALPESDNSTPFDSLRVLVSFGEARGSTMVNGGGVAVTSGCG